VEFVLEVQLENGVVTPITVRQGDRISQLAQEYVSKYGIPASELPQVKAVIRAGVARHNEARRAKKLEARVQHEK